MDLNAWDVHFIFFLVYRSWTMQHSGLIWMHDHTKWYQTFASKYYVMMMFQFVSTCIAVNTNEMNATRWVTLHRFPNDMNTHDIWHLISMKQQLYHALQLEVSQIHDTCTCLWKRIHLIQQFPPLSHGGSLHNLHLFDQGTICICLINSLHLQWQVCDLILTLHLQLWVCDLILTHRNIWD